MEYVWNHYESRSSATPDQATVASPARRGSSPFLQSHRSRTFVSFLVAVLLVAAASMPDACVGAPGARRSSKEKLSSEDRIRSLESFLREDDELAGNEELQQELSRVKMYFNLYTTTTTKPPPQNIVLDAGKEISMGVWNGLLAPFRLFKNLLTKPTTTMEAAAMSGGMTMSKLGHALRATVSSEESSGRHWRELGRDLVRAATMHPERQRELERLSRIHKAQMLQAGIYRTDAEQEEADRRLKIAMGYDEKKKAEALREYGKQKERYLKYQKLREQEAAAAAGKVNADQREAGEGPREAAHGQDEAATPSEEVGGLSEGSAASLSQSSEEPGLQKQADSTR
ncbi:hypothetical protein BESB_022970 [Besnoitia besnoiti]|uniref:Uncharacterized protein n=1 Tax=Besnoitia besnoiti TaxID=94643 RepID=A0A2A9M1E1_BESBE|nr:hypothetical protein BESB_022970 [Besnoitia besnoiti]PFH31805.1 hypothetical protein BESB_022970 [Besnoitia besnoiti]